MKFLKKVLKEVFFSVYQLLLCINFLKIKYKAVTKKQLKIGFFVVYDASWGARPLFERLINNPKFDVKIVVCPDIARGIENCNFVLEKTFKSLVDLYGDDKVLFCKNKETGEFLKFDNQFDLFFLAYPYNGLTYKYYKPSYLLKKFKLIVFNDYGYQSGLMIDYMLMKTPEYNCFWKFCVDNEEYKKIAKKEMYTKGRNVIVTGNCKMDLFKRYEQKKGSSRKTVMIAPHHSINKNDGWINLSNFIRLASFFKQLPILYPSVDFIFRPHPMLLTALKKDDVWGEKKVEDYMKELLSFPNVVYSENGIYFGDFQKSDALIDDCGSFLAEYFYTKKPQCYILNKESDINKDNSQFRKEFLENVYIAYTENDIIRFLDNVVLGGNDVMKDLRYSFAENTVMYNYPNVSEAIENYLEKKFCL